jgi:homoserine dehydrogenase
METESKTMQVGVIGFGTIGTGVVRVLLKDKALISARAGCEINLKKVAELHPTEKAGIDFSRFEMVGDAAGVLNDDDIDLVVEVIGGVNPAKDFVETALRNKKHVVTANKELMAKCGKGLISLAKENKVNLYFEASAGGGVPIINALSSSLAANPFEKIYGILNGTTNYILTEMHDKGADFDEVLKEAQALGFAEADPSADVDGDDVVYKLSILGAIAFDSYFDYRDIYKQGITGISIRDIEIAKEFGHVIKLLAIGVALDDQRVDLRVHPVMVPASHPLASVSGSFNAVFVEGENVGETMFYGRGAGELPTASAIVGDIIHIARTAYVHGTSRALNFGQKKKTVLPIGEVVSSYFLRLRAADEPGVLAEISKAFGDNRVSIRSVQQQDYPDADAEIIIITHSVKESAMQKATAQVEKLSAVSEVCALIRVGL